MADEEHEARTTTPVDLAVLGAAVAVIGGFTFVLTLDADSEWGRYAGLALMGVGGLVLMVGLIGIAVSMGIKASR